MGAVSKMSILYRHLILGLWIMWGIYWSLSARHVKAVRRREDAVSRASHLVPLAVAALLLFLPLSDGVLGSRFLARSSGVFWIGAVCVAAGLLFSIWARVHLGRNWSATVTLKEGHELIRSGPYRWVRHPIYTGLLLAFAGSAIALGEWRGLLAVLIAFVALWRKLRLEERWLSEAFGADYERYRAEVAALIPFVI